MKKGILALLLLLLSIAAAAALAEENTRVLHYLLLGQDGYAESVVDDARTDTILLISLDEKYNRVIMTSVLRDSRISTPRGTQTKANLLYKAYGFDGMIESLQNALDIEIEGAVLVNFENVKPVIDALGGVDIEIDMNEYISIRKILLGRDPNMPKGPGLVHMTGRIALAYMRDRQSGAGDFSRTERQRKVMSLLLEKCRQMSMAELFDIYNAVSPGMKISLSMTEILKALSSGYKLLENNAQFVEYHIPQNGTYAYGTLGGSSSLEVRWTTNRDQFHHFLDTEPVK